MNWSDLASRLIEGGARLAGGALGTVVAGPAGTVVGERVGGMVAGWLGVDATPEAVAQRLEDPAAMQIVVEKEAEHRFELERLVLALVQTEIEQTGQSYRKELESEDPFVRRARPTWLYTMSRVWAFQVVSTFTTAFVALISAIFSASFTIADLVKVIDALARVNESTLVMWGAALSVVGIYNWRRTTDKQTQAGAIAPPPTMGGLIGRLMGTQER